MMTLNLIFSYVAGDAGSKVVVVVVIVGGVAVVVRVVGSSDQT